MSKIEDLVGKESYQTWSYMTEYAIPEIKIVEQNEQIIAELKSISENMRRIAILIQTRFGELEQSQ